MLLMQEMWSCNVSSSSVMKAVLVLKLIVIGLLVFNPAQCSCQVVNALNMDQQPAVCNKGCANLGNIKIPKPFVVEELLRECAPDSVDFVVANCSRGQKAVWKSFTKALPQLEVEKGIIGPPAIIGLESSTISELASVRNIYVNLTWDLDYFKRSSNSSTPRPPPPLPSACRSPRPSTKFPNGYVPASLNLSWLQVEAAPVDTVAISSNTIFLLFNCSDNNVSLTSSLKVVPSGSLCQMYRGACNANLTAMFGIIPANCYQLGLSQDDSNIIQKFSDEEYDDLISQQLALQQILDRMACTHFEVFVVSNTGRSNGVAEVGQWLPGVMQLRLLNFGCLKCLITGGTCVYDDSYNTLKGCNCTDGKYFNESSGTCYYNFYGCSMACIWTVIVVVPCIGGLLVLVFLCCCGYRWGKRSMKNQRRKRRVLMGRQDSVGPNDNSMHNELVGLIELSERPVEFSFKSIESATNSFSSWVGKGAFGVVYKGVLAASKTNLYNKEPAPSAFKEIAVKVLDARSQHSKKQFVNEIAIIGRVHHINVVRLLGFCAHDEGEMLVYEYVTNGSLDQWLFDVKHVILNWKQRYSIAAGIARGLSYLHEECRHRIVHCDVKPQNILLDGQMCPKIADFGLARLLIRGESRVVTFAKGTPGYMAPELWLGGDIQLSTKADVYSFGMVLLELISGCRNFAHGLLHFPAVAYDKAINKGDFDSLLDDRLTRSEQLEPDNNIQQQKQIRTAVLVALWCIQDNPAGRPCMSEVVHFLEGVAAVSEHPPYPTFVVSAADGSIRTSCPGIASHPIDC